MPTIPFDPRRRLIQVPVIVTVNGQRQGLTFILDTGAAQSGLSQSVLTDIGINWQSADRFARVSTASDNISVPIVTIPSLEVFGITFTNLSVLALPFPIGVTADGVLGFDLLSRFWLFINYRRGLLVAEPMNRFFHRFALVWQIFRAW
ncbi:MAG: retroviral-like aspartic protease family protein [Armatimonadetes bacterium]|nr:retroviral-like aspartic protease family protein [Armatimonadota bacterium]